MMYYGTESGMWGANDPCDRQPMLWDDIRCEVEATTINGPCRPRGRAVDKSLLAFCRHAIALRKKHATLRRGSLRWVDTGNERLLGFVRNGSGEEILCLFNAGDHPATYQLKKSARNLWNGGGTVRSGRITVEPRAWRILLLRCE